MKKFFALASFVALTLSACSEEVAQGEQKGEGRVTIRLEASAEVVDTRAKISCQTPAADDFALTIERVGGEPFTADYESVAAFNADSYLKYGEYTAKVVHGDVTDEGYNKPTFAGEADFVVAARKHTDVAITATIANAIVKVEATEAFKNYFVGGYTLTLRTAQGSEFDVTAQDELLFIAPADFTISGSATKQPSQSGAEGVVVTLPEYKATDVKPQTLYTVKFDVEDAGSATLTITLNETLVESIEIEQELNDNAK